MAKIPQRLISTSISSSAILALIVFCAVSPRHASAASHADAECTAARHRAVEYGRSVAKQPGGRELGRAAMDEALAFCRERRTNRAEAAHQALARHCEQLRSWLTASPLPVVPGGTSSRSANPDRAVMMLIEDARFSAAFGKNYDELTQEELRAFVSQVLPRCFTAKGPLHDLGSNEKAAAHRALNTGSFLNNARALSESRLAADRLEKLGIEAGNLQASETDYARLIAMWREADALLPGATDERRDRYEQNYAAAEKRVALPVESAMVARTLSTAQNYDGLVKLMQLSDSLGRASLAHEVEVARDENRKRLAARSNEIGAALASAERRKIDAIGSGMSGLENGVNWRRDFDARFKTLASKVEPISKLGAYFDDKRKVAVTATQDEFRQYLQRTSSDAEIDKFVARYIIPSEPSGAVMMAAVAAQRYELEKRAIIGPRAVGGSLAAATGREPTTDEMFDAISVKLMGFSQGISNIQDDCMAGAISRDAPSAIMCLYVINAANHGATSPSKIGRFEKIGCAQAVGKAGYMCDYIIGLKGGVMGAIGPVLGGMVASGETTTSRFVYSRERGWIHISQQDDR